MTLAASSPLTLRLGARGSLLSRAQSRIVADALIAIRPNLKITFTIISTTGDQIPNKPLHAFGGKGLFTKELEMALLAGEVDFAVHSFKDVPVTMPLVEQAELMIAAVPERGEVRDVLVSHRATHVTELPVNATVGTGSLRRRAQLLAARPDLRILPVRGNIDTRLRKLREGEFDAVILAGAGLHRAGLFDPAIMFPIETDIMLPAAGQGALALECRRSLQTGEAGTSIVELLEGLNHAPSALGVRLERLVVAGLKGDCQSPIGVLATIDESAVHLRVAVGKKGGEPPMMRAMASAPLGSPELAVATVLAQLEKQNVGEHLHGSDGDFL